MEDNELPTSRTRVLAQLDRMVAAGQILPNEAATIRAADTDDTFAKAMGQVRARHAIPKLAAAVEAGDMTRSQADTYLERLLAGTHISGLRGHLARAARHRSAKDLSGR